MSQNIERCSFRVNNKSRVAYIKLREWCRVNRIPMGRLFNATIQAMQGLRNYNEMGVPKHCIIDVQYPLQTDVDDVIRYRKYKASLTRVKGGNNNE